MHRSVSAIGLLLLGACSAAADPISPMSPASVARRDADQRIASWIRTAEPADGALMLRTGRVDLDGDGVDEVLAYAGGPMRCGTGGCTLLVLRAQGKTFSKLGAISSAQLPIGVLATTTNGRRDLAVTVYGGGLRKAIMAVPFDGVAYAANATVAPATETARIGTIIIEDMPLNRMD